MEYDFLYEVNDGIATLTFNRPRVLNALTLCVLVRWLFSCIERVWMQAAIMRPAYLKGREMPGSTSGSTERD